MIQFFNQFFKLKTKSQIEAWLYHYQIKNFFIHDNLVVDVQGDVNLKDKNLSFLPIQFGVIHGTFDISDNHLTTLKGSPNEVKDDFACDSNKLRTLKYAPKKVGKLFYFVDNPIAQIKSLTIECEEMQGGYIAKKRMKRKEVKALSKFYEQRGEFHHLKWFTFNLSTKEIQKALNINK